MPVRSVESSPGHRVFEFTCEHCGKPACTGVGVDLLRAIRTGNVTYAGRWFCGFRGGAAYCQTTGLPAERKAS